MPLARLLLAALALFVVLGGGRPAAAADPGRVVVETAAGTHEFTVELATTERERASGLMYRQTLAADAGMLFDFGVDQEVSMWMHNTYIPLDMVFIEADGTVRRIAADTTPFSTEIVSSRGPVRAVLELNAGTARSIGLKRGDKVRHPMFGNAE